MSRTDDYVDGILFVVDVGQIRFENGAESLISDENTYDHFGRYHVIVPDLLTSKFMNWHTRYPVESFDYQRYSLMNEMARLAICEYLRYHPNGSNIEILNFERRVRLPGHFTFQQLAPMYIESMRKRDTSGDGQNTAASVEKKSPTEEYKEAATKRDPNEQMPQTKFAHHLPHHLPHHLLVDPNEGVFAESNQ